MRIPGFNPRSKTALIIGGLVAFDAALLLTGTLSLVSILLTIGLLAYAFFRLTRAVVRRSRLIWRLRNRLIVTYLFIGLVPIILILVLSYLGAWIVVGQVATYLVSSELSRRASALESPSRYLSRAQPAERATIVSEIAPMMRMRDPGFEILVTDGGTSFRYPDTSSLSAPPAGWKDYTGLLYKDGQYYCMSLATSGSTRALILAPLTTQVLETVVRGLGTMALYHAGLEDSQQDPDLRPAKGRGRLGHGVASAGEPPQPYNVLDRDFPWLNPIDAASWDHPGRKELTVLNVNTKISAVLSTVFGDHVDTAQTVLVAFVVLVCLLAGVELLSIVIGVSMTRAITGAVHELYEGTLHIGRGDFSHRIKVRGRDQLADLGHSFNKMSAQIENLVVVAKEKERLQSELAIASEVQNQLFPREAPPARTIQLVGTCEPARSVSGDYYDYLCLPDGNLALAIGDVAGKGISAALLMASIQSIMRTQLAAGVPATSTAKIVAQLNRQLWANTSPEKYATFFFGLYDEQSRVLRYTNAGHLSPLHVKGGKVTELQSTGTVVGIFPSVQYGEQSVRLDPGDLLVAYTDGITEPENPYGEEFGAERLAEAVLRNQNAEPWEIVAKVMEAVKQWSHAPELPDDMTVMIARGIA